MGSAQSANTTPYCLPSAPDEPNLSGSSLLGNFELELQWDLGRIRNHQPCSSGGEVPHNAFGGREAIIPDDPSFEVCEKALTATALQSSRSHMPKVLPLRKCSRSRIGIIVWRRAFPEWLR
jgi:hypothetical protein